MWRSVLEYISQIRSVSRRVWLLLLAYACSSAAMTPMLFFFTDYCGETVFGGVALSNNAQAKERYENGVQFGALLLAGLNVAVLGLVSVVF